MSSSSFRSSNFSALAAGALSAASQDVSDPAAKPWPEQIPAAEIKRKCTVELKAQALGPLRAAVESSAASARLLDAARSAVEQVAFENCEAATSAVADVAAAAENLSWNSGGNAQSHQHEQRKDSFVGTWSRLLG